MTVDNPVAASTELQPQPRTNQPQSKQTQLTTSPVTRPSLPSFPSRTFQAARATPRDLSVLVKLYVPTASGGRAYRASMTIDAEATSVRPGKSVNSQSGRTPRTAASSHSVGTSHARSGSASLSPEWGGTNKPLPPLQDDLRCPSPVYDPCRRNSHEKASHPGVVYS
jgi:hypothetical protein